jgi:Family of unknown function (DUF6520)
MKNIRMILPAVAILFAGAGALASNFSGSSVAIQDVTTLTSSPCTKVGTCNTSFTGESCQSATNNRRIKSGLSCPNPVGVGRFTAN